MAKRVPRRKLLKTVGAGSVIGLSGCIGGQGNDDEGSSSGGSSGGSGGSSGGSGGDETETSSGSGGSGSSEKIKIGTNFPLSGGLALNGQECTRGVELMVEQINNDGGINGRQIELIKKDAKDSDAGVSNVEALATSDNVDAIFGTYSSSISKASVQAAARYDVVYLEMTAFSPEISAPGYQHFYHCSTRTPQYGQEGGKIISNIITPQIDTDTPRVGVLYENGVFGTSTKNLVKEQADQFGYEVVQTIGYPPFETSDLSSAITKLKQSDLDLLYHSGYNADTNLLWKQAADLNFYVPAVVGNGTAYVVQSFVEAVSQQTALGIINVDQPHYNVNSDFAPGMKDVLSAYRDKYGETPVTQLPATTYSVTQMFKEIASKAESFELDAFEEAALSVDKPLGSFANGYGVKFSKDKHRNQNVSVAGTQWQFDTFTEDLLHPKKRPEKLDVYGVYPDDAKVSYTEIKNIPRPDYTKQ